MTLTETDQLGCPLRTQTANVSRNIVPRVIDNTNQHDYTKKNPKNIIRLHRLNNSHHDDAQKDCKPAMDVQTKPESDTHTNNCQAKLPKFSLPTTHQTPIQNPRNPETKQDPQITTDTEHRQPQQTSADTPLG